MVRGPRRSDRFALVFSGAVWLIAAARARRRTIPADIVFPLPLLHGTHPALQT